jgi:hypothetical protein
MSVWADGVWMLDGDGLGDLLVAVLADEPDGLPCADLVVLLRRRRGDVLAVLRADSRFEHSGRGGRGSRWRVVPSMRLGRIGAAFSGNGGHRLACETSPVAALGREA